MLIFGPGISISITATFITSNTTSILFTTNTTFGVTTTCGSITPIYYTLQRKSVDENGTRTFHSEIRL